MKRIEAALKPIDGYLISIARDTVNGWYEIEIGLPPTWVFDGNKKIGCEVLIDSDEGKLIKITPKNNNIVIDDLVDFVGVIIIANQKIVEKEKQFTDTMEEMKKELEEKAKDYFQEIEEITEESFKKVNKEFVESLEGIKPKRGRPKGSKNTSKIEKKDEHPITITEETTVIESSKE